MHFTEFHNRKRALNAVLMTLCLIVVVLLVRKAGAFESLASRRAPEDSEETATPTPTPYTKVIPKDSTKKYSSPETEMTMRASRLPGIHVDGRKENAWNVCTRYKLENPVFGDDGATAGFYAFCDENKLYLLIEVHDNTPQLSGEIPTRCDCVEVFLNEDGEKSERYHAGDSHYIVERNGSLDERSGADRRLVEYNVISDDDGYVVEIGIRWSLDPEERANEFGLDIRVNDSQTAGERNYIVQWSDTSMMTHEDLSHIGTIRIR